MAVTMEEIIRPNILSLLPYRCARDDFSEGILLDANENALGHALPSPSDEDNQADLHRYPSPLHIPIKEQLCALRGVKAPENVFLGVGSDEVIDLLYRIVCKPAVDSVLVCPPTYGMYSVCAQINDINVVKVEQDPEFGIRVPEINAAISAAASSSSPVKLVFLCSPGNPTSTLIPLADVRAVLANPDFRGILVVDEAYIDFAPEGSSAVELLNEEKWENLVVMQTLSKGFGLAAIRLGIAFSSPPLIQILNNIKAPYNISTPTAQLATRALSAEGLTKFRSNIVTLNANRETLAKAVVGLPGVIGLLGQGRANFLMVQLGGKEDSSKPDSKRAHEIYMKMAQTLGVVVRYRGSEPGCAGCLRVTVGTEAECEEVVKRLGECLAA